MNVRADTGNLLRAARSALLERATRLGIARDSEEAIIDALLEREVQVEPPSEAECRAYYVAHQALFRGGTLVEADHILFVAHQDAYRPMLRDFAQEKLAALRRGEVDFADAAKRWSNCPSGAVGGSLGQLTREQVVPEFWQALEEFGAVGIMPSLIETRFGVHIVRVTRRASGDLLPFEFVADRIAAHLADRRLRAALLEYAHALVREASGEDVHAH
jgi:peptidyl-prolyl cis-trans isomerase C